MALETADEVTRELIAWIGETLPDVPVSARSPSSPVHEDGVDVRLMAIAPRPSPRVHAPPAIVDLDYLITIRMSDPFAEQKALGELLLSAMSRTGCEIVRGRSAAQACSSVGIPIANGFVLRAPLIREREAKRAPLVRFPLKVHSSEMGSIEGRVLGPGDTPIMGAMVSADSLGRQTYTDAEGRFRLAGAPRDATGVVLSARARGATTQATVKAGESAVLRLSLEV